MNWLRRLFGLDFPDPKAGQVWRSLHSGRAFRVQRVERTDDGTMWRISMQTELSHRKFTGMGNTYLMCSLEWRNMLKREARILES